MHVGKLMKRIVHILLLGLTLCLAGCQGMYWSDDLEFLDTIDSLLVEKNYNTAYNVIISTEELMRKESQDVRMRFELQKIKATDKLSKPLLTDSAILPIIDYYEHDGDKTQLPEAYYYAGRIYYSLRDYPRSMEYFNKALDVVNEDENYLLSRIHSQKGYLFHNQGLFDEAIKSHHQSYDDSFKVGDTIGMIHSSRDIGNSFSAQDDFKNAFYFYDKGEELAVLVNDSSLKSLIGIDKANTYSFMGEYELAEKYLNQSICYVDSMNVDYANTVAGYLYFIQHKYDLAKSYYNKLLYSSSVYTRQNGEAGLLNIAANDKDINEALKHLLPYKELTDSISLITDSEIIARINSLYNSRRLERQNEELEKVNMRNTYYIIIGGLLLFTVIVLLMLYNYRVRSERNRLRYNNAMLDKYLQEEQMKRSLAEQERDKLAETDVIKKLKEEQGDERKNAIRESAIYQKVLNSSKALTDKDQVEIEELLNQLYPEFFTRLRSLGIVKEHDLRVCMLVKMGFSPSRIASLVSLTLSAITNTRKRMYGKVTGNRGKPEDWDQIIESL